MCYQTLELIEFSSWSIFVLLGWKFLLGFCACREQTANNANINKIRLFLRIFSVIKIESAKIVIFRKSLIPCYPTMPEMMITNRAAGAI